MRRKQERQSEQLHENKEQSKGQNKPKKNKKIKRGKTFLARFVDCTDMWWKACWAWPLNDRLGNESQVATGQGTAERGAGSGAPKGSGP